MAEFQDIAKKLAQVTVAPPSPTAEQFGKIAAGIIPQVQAGTAPFLQQRVGDVIKGELAADPLRLDLAVEVGRPEWVKAVQEFKEKRDELLSFKPGQPTKIPVKKTVTKTFDKGFMDNMTPGQQIQIGDTVIRKNQKGGGFVFREIGSQAWVRSQLGQNENIIKHFGTDVSVEEETGEFVTKPAKTRQQMRRELDNIRNKFNQIVPKKSELERLLMIELQKRAKEARTGAVPTDRFALEKYKAAERRINLLSSKDKGTLDQLQKLTGDIPFASIQDFVTGYFRDVNNTLTEKSIKAGKYSEVENATFNSLRTLNEGVVDQQLAKFRQAINNDIQKINKLPKQSDRILDSYALLLRVAPLADRADKAVAGAVADVLLLDTLQQAVINPAVDFEGGVNNLPRYLTDYKNMIEIAIKEKKMDVKDRGQNLFKDLSNQVRRSIPEAKLPGKVWGLIGRGTSPDNIKKIVARNLIDDPDIAKLAPRTKEAFDNPTETQKKWIALFEATHGRKPTLTDINKAAGTVKAGKVSAEREFTPELPKKE
jgi:hypothetical protein